jgi:hypothetical protein
VRILLLLQVDGEVNDEWFRELWISQFPCLRNANTNCSIPQSLNQSNVGLDWSWPAVSRIYDGVYVFAHAVHNAIVDTCPDAFFESPHKSAMLKKCLNGRKVLKYMKVSNTGSLHALFI